MTPCACRILRRWPASQRSARRWSRADEPAGPEGASLMAESALAKKTRARKILQRLDGAYPGAAIALHFSNPLELLVATILSAQCTDERVNAVTETLFTRYRAAKDYALAEPATLEREIHSTGFFKAKARALIGVGRALVERHGGVVPRTLDQLTALPGVGRKTANVVLGNAFGVPALAVDPGHAFADHPWPEHLPRPKARLPPLSRERFVPVDGQDQAETSRK